MLLHEPTQLAQNTNPLVLSDLPEPSLQEGEVLVRVLACGVCHTELDEIEGRTAPPHLPVVLGHQVVGVVEESRSVREAQVAVTDTSKAAEAATTAAAAESVEGDEASTNSTVQ